VSVVDGDLGRQLDGDVSWMRRRRHPVINVAVPCRVDGRLAYFCFCHSAPADVDNTFIL